MKVTKENIKDITYIEGYYEIWKKIDWRKLLENLLIDLEELNKFLKDKEESYRELYIDYEDKHTEYSPERTDPCPDYYGMFKLRFEKNPNESVGDYMDLRDLDTIICSLYDFVSI